MLRDFPVLLLLLQYSLKAVELINKLLPTFPRVRHQVAGSSAQRGKLKRCPMRREKEGSWKEPFE